MPVESPDWIEREIRSGVAGGLSVSTYELLRRAVAAGDRTTAADLVRYLHAEERDRHHQTFALFSAWMTFIAREYGEEEVNRNFRTRNQYLTPLNAGRGLLSDEEKVQSYVEVKRRQRSGPGQWGDVTVAETPASFTVTSDPCGTGGWLLRLDEEFGPLEYVGRTQEPHPWSWGRTGVPYYCCHVCIAGELMPMEQTGRLPGATDCCSRYPGAPCDKTFFKRQSDIPQSYFDRIGMKRPSP